VLQRDGAATPEILFGIRALLAADLSVRRVNPNKLRQFGRARGVLAKNDCLDARLIAEYVAIMPTRVVQRDPATEQLPQVVTMRRQLCDEHVAVENQTALLEDATLRRLNKRRLARLEADILLLDRRMAQQCQSHDQLSSLPHGDRAIRFAIEEFPNSS
jgi:transposase